VESAWRGHGRRRRHAAGDRRRLDASLPPAEARHEPGRRAVPGCPRFAACAVGVFGRRMASATWPDDRSRGIDTCVSDIPLGVHRRMSTSRRRGPTLWP
jgi:hypothetical protein